eukprot:EG_transcript_38175
MDLTHFLHCLPLRVLFACVQVYLVGVLSTGRQLAHVWAVPQPHAGGLPLRPSVGLPRPTPPVRLEPSAAFAAPDRPPGVIIPAAPSLAPEAFLVPKLPDDGWAAQRRWAPLAPALPAGRGPAGPLGAPVPAAPTAGGGWATVLDSEPLLVAPAQEGGPLPPAGL